MKPIAIALHGGAGTLTKGSLTAEQEGLYLHALSEARDTGYEILSSGGSALDAVEMVVRLLEDSPLFNAGKGSVFTHSGEHEMDASIMNGKTLEAGAVALVKGIKNPIVLARQVMEHSGHVFLAGAGALDFAGKMGHQILGDDYFYDQLRYDQWQAIKDSDQFDLDHNINPEGKFGTVGAVALDAAGNLAAATSTGGMTNKKFGRIGDSPMIGAGTYANNKTCAVSCTGSGEYFIRGVVAYDVSAAMEYGKLTLEQACHEVVHKRLVALNGDGGLVALDAQGNITMSFNTEGMYRACKSSARENVAIYG